MRYLIFLAFSACGPSSPVGQSCTKDSECGSFHCLHDKHADSSNMCVDLGSEGSCGPACTTNKECQAYGATMKCALSFIDVACNPSGRCLDNYKCTGSMCRLAPE